ncbi:MAG: helix-turn-helix transcriptional regulator [Oscillospiraceae bacterium]|nr:helix-turn-helix transcriptional regulator [Oscillospiraceae bacterium]
MQEFNYVYNSEKENAPFAVKLRNLFEERGVVKRELAEYIEARTGEGVTRQAIGQWCKGYTCPNLKMVPIIAEFFGVSCDYLLTDTDIETPDTEIAAVCKYTGLSSDAVLTLNDCYSHRNYPKLNATASKIIATGLFSDMAAELSALEQESKNRLSSYDFMLTETTEKREIIQKIADLLQVDYMTLKWHLISMSHNSSFENQYNTVLPADVSCDLHRYNISRLCEDINDLFDYRKGFLNMSREELLDFLQLSEEQLKDMQNNRRRNE